MYHYDIKNLIERYPLLETIQDDIVAAEKMLIASFKNGNKLLVAGNGGSSADAEHIVGELMKGFKSSRPLPMEFQEKLKAIDPLFGAELANKLQGAVPAIALHNHQGLNTAFVNDVDNGGMYTFGQQILGYGQEGDIFLAITTSGNSKNILYAATVARAKGLKIIALTGKNGGKIKEVADVSIVVPTMETYEIQEYHLPIYHYLCLRVEEELFD